MYSRLWLYQPRLVAHFLNFPESITMFSFFHFSKSTLYLTFETLSPSASDNFATVFEWTVLLRLGKMLEVLAMQILQ